jgi:hypothetical protein
MTHHTLMVFPVLGFLAAFEGVQVWIYCKVADKRKDHK